MPRSAVPRSRAHAHSKAAHAQTHARSHSLTHAALRCAQVHVVAAGGKVDADAAAEQTALDRHAAAASARLRAQKATIDADAVGQFCDMGFPLNAVSRALLASGNSTRATLASAPAQTAAVIDWLLAHGEDHDFNEPLAGDSTDAGAATKRSDSADAGAATKRADVGAATKRVGAGQDSASAALDISAEMDDASDAARRGGVHEIDDAANQRFDCVCGWHDGARMYIFYDSSQCYPEYLVQYHA